MMQLPFDGSGFGVDFAISCCAPSGRCCSDFFSTGDRLSAGRRGSAVRSADGATACFRVCAGVLDLTEADRLPSEVADPDPAPGADRWAGGRQAAGRDARWDPEPPATSVRSSTTATCAVGAGAVVGVAAGG